MNPDMTTEEARMLCMLAGLDATEMLDHPEHGVLISPSGARKLSLIAPDQRRAQDFRDFIAEVVRSQLSVVPGGK